MTLRVHPIIYPLALVSAFAIGQFGCKSEVPELEPVEPMTTSEYVDMVVDYDLELSTLIDDGCLAEDISERLVVLDNTTPEHYAGKYPSVEVMEKPTPEQLEKFHPQYLILIHYLLNALSNSDFRAEIGTELELDTEDTSGEHGGALHLSEDGDVSIEMLADRSSDPSMHFIGDEIGLEAIAGILIDLIILPILSIS